MNLLAPSILAADFTRLGQEIKAVEEAGVQYLHIDIMDGKFVPSISFGMPVVESIRKSTGLFFDVHLMIEQPERYIREFAAAGADLQTVHAEACIHLDRTIEAIKEAGCKAGVALNPATPVSVIEHILPKLDLVLIMSVNPGFGGQKYIPYCTAKIRQIRNLIESQNLAVQVEVDGGITKENVGEVIEAGADVIVAGSAVFRGDSKKNAAEFLELIKE